LNDTNKQKYLTTFSNLLTSTTDVKQAIPKSIDLKISKPNQFNVLFTYLNPENVEPSIFTKTGYITSYFNGMNNMIETKPYNTILDFIIDSVDVYGLGFSLQYIANCFKRNNALSLEEFTRLSSLFNKMYDFNPETRVIDLNELINEYESVLLENGVLGRLGKSFENNALVNKPPLPINIIKEAKKQDSLPPKQLSPELQKFANLNVIEVSTRSPRGKENNHSSKRSLKKCSPGFERNDKFRCVKTKRDKAKRNKLKYVRSTSKKCPEGKILNPTTNRCVKKCAPGFERNAKFRCVKTKKAKLSSVKMSSTLKDSAKTTSTQLE
jgi:hypothetical protein